MNYVVTRNVIDNVDVKEELIDISFNPQSMVNSRIAVSYALYTQR